MAIDSMTYKVLFRPVCWLRGFWYDFGKDMGVSMLFSGMRISGCNWVEQPDGHLICETCGAKHD
jgi:hypothetical protein